MGDKLQDQKEENIDLIQYFRIFLKRKWWFIATFIIILIAGIIYTFLQSPAYSCTSVIKPVARVPIGLLSNYYPAEEYKLKSVALEEISLEMQSGAFKNKMLIDLDNKISLPELSEAINITVDLSKKMINVVTSYKQPDIAYEINKSIINIYNTESSKELTGAYDNIISNIENDLTLINAQISDLSASIEESLIDINLKIAEKFVENKIPGDSGSINFIGINYIPPVLSQNISALLVQEKELNKIKNNMVYNKEYYTNSIEVIIEPQSAVSIENNKTRNIIISIFLALLSGVAMIYVANYFIILKTRNKL